MWRYFTPNSTQTDVRVLQKFLMGYHKHTHRNIGMDPEDVTHDNEENVWEKLYGTEVETCKQIFRFHLKDTVRVTMTTQPFRKGYLSQWTEEVFTVAERIPRTPSVYKLKDYGGETIAGTFYEHEMQEVSKGKDHLYLIEKIIRRRTHNGEKLFFVKWKGYPSKFNSSVKGIYTGFKGGDTVQLGHKCGHKE